MVFELREQLEDLAPAPNLRLAPPYEHAERINLGIIQHFAFFA
jgi:hypothetical protein